MIIFVLYLYIYTIYYKIVIILLKCIEKVCLLEFITKTI